MTGVETVVIGAGPAGSATACGLAALGRDVLLIERSAAPHHKVCGEFLSVETQLLSRRLGVDPSALGAAEIDEVVLHSVDRSVRAALPFRALSLSRYRLDDALLQSALRRGARLKRSVSVRQVMPNGSGWNVLCDNGEVVRCRNLVLATGKLGLRGIDDERDRSLVGLKMHLRPSPAARRALDGRVELFFLNDTYVGLEMIEDGVTNLCLVLPATTVRKLESGWLGLHDHLTAALPALAARLAGAEPLWDKPKGVVCPVGGHLHRETHAAVYRVGDRLAHIPPFTGDGLAIALGSAALAVEHIRRGLAPDVYLAAARQLTASPIRLAGLVSGLIRYGAARQLMFGAAAVAPGMVGALVRRTRLPLAPDA